MAETVTRTRFFTIADYEEEEAWLRGQHQQGWRLVSLRLPCFYTFEQCEPADVVYRLDFTDNGDDAAQLERLREEGWSYFARCAGWLYFRKSAAEDPETEPFGSGALRAEMIRTVIRSRLLPLLIILNCCLLQNLALLGNGPVSTVLRIVFSVLVLLYLYLIVYCAVKFRRLRKKYEGKYL